METAGYATLSRQAGLVRALQVVANNIANAGTTGFRQEDLVFSEYVKNAPGRNDLSLTRAAAFATSGHQGGLTQTGGKFDLAIEGAGFFQVETDRGPRLTRAGAFSPGPGGDLLSGDGYRLLNDEGAPVFAPPGQDVRIAADGTISADGQPLGRIGLFLPVEAGEMHREDGVLFRSDAGVDPAPEGRILQGFLEDSNVNPIAQIARLVEIQRAYEMGQKFLDSEDDRIRQAVKALIRAT